MNKQKEDTYSVMLDTSFLIRLVSTESEWHDNAVRYFKEFLNRQIPMHVSSIALGEFLTRHDMNDLPKDIRLAPFNALDSMRTGEYAKTLLDLGKTGVREIGERDIIKTDVMLFAQASNLKVKYFVTTDAKSQKYVDTLTKEFEIPFEVRNISATGPNEHFGLLFDSPEV